MNVVGSGHTVPPLLLELEVLLELELPLGPEPPEPPDPPTLDEPAAPEVLVPLDALVVPEAPPDPAALEEEPSDEAPVPDEPQPAHVRTITVRDHRGSRER